MSFINGNIPIVTTGLIYAADFGNTKTYSAGTSFNSLVFPNIVTSISQSSTIILSSSLYFTGSNNTATFPSTSISALNSTSSFTIQWVGLPKNTISKFFINQELPSAELLYTKISSGSLSLSLFNKQNSGFNGRLFNSGQYDKNLYTWVYDQGSHLFYVNGFPITASSNLVGTSSNDSGTNTFFSYNGMFFDYSGSTVNTNTQWSGSLDHFYVYNRALPYNEVYQNYLVAFPRYKLPLVPKLAVDPNTYLYVTTANITDSNTVSALDTFITGLKSNNLWNKIAISYPLLGLTSASQAINLKDAGIYKLQYSTSWSFSNSGSAPNYSGSFITSSFSPVSTNNFSHPNLTYNNSHFTYLSYDLVTTSSNLFGVSRPATISGGQLYYSESKAYHVFTASGHLLVDTAVTASILLVGGGGAGNTVVNAGGGGAGGLITSSVIIAPGSYPITIGDGGIGPATRNSILLNGQDSRFSTYVAYGGGKGGSNYSVYAANGFTGGSGGGGAQSGSGIPGQGNAGASSYGGGGGAGTTGSGVYGGSGSYIAEYATLGPGFGSPAGWFAGGGGAGVNIGGTPGKGGPGGGGSGSDGTSNGQSGLPNTGGGGGGAGYYTGDKIGGSGGSGIVIISYNTSSLLNLTSSYTVFLTDTAISSSHNSTTSTSMTSSGNIGLITVSRTGSSTSQLYKNTTLVSNTATSIASPISSIYVNAINTNNAASRFSPYSVGYLSFGLGLTTSELNTYHSLVSQLQTNLKRQNTLLDNYAGPAAAYSLRRIGPSGYFGPAIKVRRDSDNTLKDIGFTSDGNLDTVALLDFVGTGSGFVNTWYDQSTRGYDATQATAASQPQIVLSGSIIVNQYNKITLRSDGVSAMDIPAGVVPGENVYSYAFVDKLGSTSQPAAFGMQHNSNPAIIGRLRNSSADAWVAARDNSGNQIEFFPSQPNFPRFIGTFNLYTNGSQVGAKFSYSGSLGTYNTATIPSYAGRSYSTSAFRLFYGVYYYGIMKMNEVIVYPSDPGGDTIITNMINTQVISGSDTDYQAFITATGITQPTQSAALETLVSDLKSYGLWSKMKAIYPMITDKYNLYANTNTLTVSWLPVSSSITASNASGPFTSSLVASKFNDVSGSAINPSVYQTLPLVSGSVYAMSVHAKWNGTDYIILNPDNNSSTWFDIKNGYVSGSTGSVATASISRVSGTAANPSGSWYRCSIVFTSSLSGPVNTSIQMSTTNLSYTYDSTGSLSGSYLWGAQFENGDFIAPYLENTSSNAYTSGSMLDQMKYNLKDPRDLDIAIRLTYSGSWYAGYAGASGNGIDAVGHTKLTPRTAGFTNTSGHISYYQGNLPQKSSGSLFSSRQTAGADNYFSIKTDLGTETTFGSGPGYGLGGSFVSYSIPTPIGFVMANMYSTGGTLHQRNQILQSAGTPTLNNIDQLITINATSISGVPSGYSSAQCRFLTIGPGLSTYEAKALYWIVQKYQTTLGRQVY